MLKGRDRVKCACREKLTNEARTRYDEKICVVNHLDPYELPSHAWSSDLNALPPGTVVDIGGYLLFGVSRYTCQQLKNFKYLESGNQLTNGWVHDLQLHKPAGCDNSIDRSKVMGTQQLNEPP